MLKRSILWLAVAMAMGQCQAQDPPFRLPDNIEILTNLTYATVAGRDLHLDLFLPRLGAGPFPAVVYIHGGGWSVGDRSMFWRQAAYMATKGFVGASIEYRLYHEAKYPAALYDCKAAVRWLRANAEEYRIDPNRIGAAGGSAGGHLVAMLGTTAGIPEFDGSEGDPRISTRVQAVAAFNPALDLVEFGKADSDPDVPAFLGASYSQDPQLWERASPIYHVTADSAPMLFLHGTADTTVPYQQSVRMMEKLKAANVETELFSADGAKHAFFNSPPWYEPTLKRMEEFFAAQLKR